MATSLFRPYSVPCDGELILEAVLAPPISTSTPTTSHNMANPATSGAPVAGSSPTEQLRSCVHIIHNPRESNERRQGATKWLRDFQRQGAAWAVAHQLLEDPASSTQELFTAAMTLHHKICRDFGDLNTQAVVVLRDTLIKHINRVSKVRARV